jgi:hypothetical protein
MRRSHDDGLSVEGPAWATSKLKMIVRGSFLRKSNELNG